MRIVIERPVVGVMHSLQDKDGHPLDPKRSAAGEPLEGTKVLGVGPLTIGAVKYKAEFGLFKLMIEAKKPVKLDFREAFELAKDFAR